MSKRTKKSKRSRPASDPNVAAYEAVRKLTGQPARPKKSPERNRAPQKP